jgi:Ca2+-binding EF-hand superfamily protein
MMEQHTSVGDEEEEEIRMTFNVFDSDCRGFIESKVLRYVMETVQIATEVELKDMFEDL